MLGARYSFLDFGLFITSTYLTLLNKKLGLLFQRFSLKLALAIQSELLIHLVSGLIAREMSYDPRDLLRNDA